MTESRKRAEKNLGSFRHFLLIIITCIVFSLGFLPTIVLAKIITHFIAFNALWHFLILPFILYIGLALLIVSELLISGVIIRVFNIRYEPGTYEYSFNNKNAFRWILVCTLYTPCRKIIEIFPVGGIKYVYYRLLGMKIGKNTLVGGSIKDPCVTEFGDNTTMGEYAFIYGHIHNYEKGTITIKKVKIGNNCVIGAGAIIMPGVTMEDGSTIGAGGLITKNRVLEKNKAYGGNPAKEILVNKKKQKSRS